MLHRSQPLRTAALRTEWSRSWRRSPRSNQQNYPGLRSWGQRRRRYCGSCRDRERCAGWARRAACRSRIVSAIGQLAAARASSSTLLRAADRWRWQCRCHTRLWFRPRERRRRIRFAVGGLRSTSSSAAPALADRWKRSATWIAPVRPGDPLGVRTSTIADDDLDARVLAQPLGEHLGRAVVQQVNRSMRFEVHQQRAVRRTPRRVATPRHRHPALAECARLRRASRAAAAATYRG